MRHLFRAAFVMLWMGFLSGTAWSGTFYVSPTGSDSNPGSQALPWKTLRKAAAALVAGDTAIVLNGTYIEPEVAFLASGTSGNPITLKAQNQHLAILSSTAGCNPAISLYGSYVTIENMRVKRDATDTTCPGPSTRAMIRAWGSSGTGGHHGIVRGVLVDSGANLGVKMDQDFNLVENSTIHNSIEGIVGQDTIFRNNYIDGFDVVGPSVLTSKGGMKNFQFYNNIVHLTTTGSVGAVVLGGSTNVVPPAPDNYECLNCVAYNNVVINDTGSTTQPSLTARGCKNCTFFNNITIGFGSISGRAGSGAGNPFNTAFINNIFSCSGGEATNSGSYVWSGTLTIDYNNFFNCNGAPAQVHAISGDPKLVNQTTDFHLQAGSPAIGTGMTLATRPAYGGGTLDTSRDMAFVVRTTPWSLGVYSGSTGGDVTPPAVPTNLRVQ